jgi:uncharacterized glyoxalase superfamily protein PhnB
MFRKCTPNLIVRDVAKSVAFYRDELGFALAMSVPEQAPYVFAGMQRDNVEIFLNDRQAVIEELPEFANQPDGGSLTLYIEVDEVDALFERLRTRARIVHPLKDQFYGMREFAVSDPDGWVLTLAQNMKR